MTIDKLIEICENEYKRGMATGKPFNYDGGYAAAFSLCLTFAKEVKENSAVPCGEWEIVTNGRGGHKCSLCNAYAPSFQSGVEHLSDFCPGCGAQMNKK